MNLHKTGWKLAFLGVLLLFLLGMTALVGVARPPDKAGLVRVLALQEGDYAGGDTCFACHDIEEAFQKNPHYSGWEDESVPWSERGCETCHGPGQAHIDSGGDTSLIFRYTEASPQEISDNCLDCHLQLTPSEANFLRNEHGLNDVACTQCHGIHAGNVRDSLLKAPEPALCYTCHNEVRAEFNKPFHHRVNEGFMGCTDCHNQHGGYSHRQYQTSTGNFAPCFECHADKQGPFTFEHLTVRVDGCVACHTPHASNNPRLLKRSEVRFLCLECHSGTVGVEGPSPPGFHNIAQPGWQNCTTCHVEIHGSNLSPVFFVD